MDYDSYKKKLTFLKNTVLAGEEITKEEALFLYEYPLQAIEKERDFRPLRILCESAMEITHRFIPKEMDLCAIINGKSGQCSEDCKFCAQSTQSSCEIREYPMVSQEAIIQDAEEKWSRGIQRYSIVTSGKKLNREELERIKGAITHLKKTTGLKFCISGGMLSVEDFRGLKAVGVERCHNNLEASPRYFQEICTTHSQGDKLQTIENAKKAGMSICSGGIIGMGETPQDLMDLAFEVKALDVASMPLNFFNPIKGTALDDQEKTSMEKAQCVTAVFRFILPQTSLRIAGGRITLEDGGLGCFQAGANAAISGDLLTTNGITIEDDVAVFKKKGYR